MFYYTSNLLWQILSGVPTVTFWVLGYALTAASLYSMARFRGIDNAWLAWIPLGQSWLLGCISDQYRYVKCDEVRAKRWLLLLMALLIRVCVTFLIAELMKMGMELLYSPYGISEEIVIRRVLHPSLMALNAGLILIVVLIVKTVSYFLALSDLYRSSDPENATFYLVFSIFFPIIRPLFLFLNRKKELGMPPRRPAAEAEEEI